MLFVKIKNKYERELNVVFSAYVNNSRFFWGGGGCLLFYFSSLRGVSQLSVPMTFRCDLRH